MNASSNRGKKRVRFEFSAEPGSDVSVAGTFNEWQPGRHALKDAKGDGTFCASLYLPRGRHEYKFVVNGIWCVDPNCEEWTPNDLGSLNSVLKVD